MKSFQLKAKILSQTNVKNNYWHCEFGAPEIAKIALPGQFINIRVSEKCDPLLRRPVSVHGVKGERVKIFYEVVGRATEILSQKKPGEYLDIIGPLGNGFSVVARRLPVLVAGGMGVAPLVFLAAKLKLRNTLVLIGARTKRQLNCVNDFKKLGCAVKIATDDGSDGFKGKVTALLSSALSAIGYRLSAIYACGPKPMLKAISDISIKYAIPAQVSLEEHMSCGIGACLGCVVKVKSRPLSRVEKSEVTSGFEYKRICKEGPVFNAWDLVW